MLAKPACVKEGSDMEYFHFSDIAELSSTLETAYPVWTEIERKNPGFALEGMDETGFSDNWGIACVSKMNGENEASFGFKYASSTIEEFDGKIVAGSTLPASKGWFSDSVIRFSDSWMATELPKSVSKTVGSGFASIGSLF